MSIYDLISKWIKELNGEMMNAKNESNLLKMTELNILKRKLLLIRDGKRAD